MNKFIITLVFVMLAIPLTAHANLTEQELVQYNKEYLESHISCNPNTIVDYMNKHYHPSYVAETALPNGYKIKMDKEEFLKQTKTGLYRATMHSMDCAPDMSSTTISVTGDSGVVKTSSGPANCDNHFKKINGTVYLMKSVCELDMSKVQ